LLLRSEVGGDLEHIIVSINGPDSRTGDTTIQDKKQAFLEELRERKWGYRDMPLTVSRTWSRLGHAQSLDAAIPWVHTAAYLAMHDDTIVIRPKWESLLRHFWENPEVAIAYAPPLLVAQAVRDKFNDEPILVLPHLNTTFLLCKKHVATKLGVKWSGYHTKHSFDVDQEFVDSYKEISYNDLHGHYEWLSHDIGALAYNRLSPYKRLPLVETVAHLTAMSWQTTRSAEMVREEFKSVLLPLEAEIKASPYADLWEKYQ
jgi:hypothetical protein